MFQKWSWTVRDLRGEISSSVGKNDLHIDYEIHGDIDSEYTYSLCRTSL